MIVCTINNTEELAVLDIGGILLNKCIKKYNDVVEDSRNNIRFGVAPKSMIIACSHENCAWKYKDREINKISADEEFQREPISGMYFNEAYAEFGYDMDSQKAFINIYFGPRFAKGFEYTIVNVNNEYDIKDEVILWVS